jgi:DNA-binding transcriptional MerR regulator
MQRTERQFLGTTEVATALGVSPSLIRKLERIGYLDPAERVGGSDRLIWPAGELDLLRVRISERQTAVKRENSRRKSRTAA